MSDGERLGNIPCKDCIEHRKADYDRESKCVGGRVAMCTFQELKAELAREQEEKRYLKAMYSQFEFTLKERIKELESKLQAADFDCDALRSHLKLAESALAERSAALERYKNGLKEIAYSDHCQYDKNEAGSYGIGVTDGHRCAADIARKYLEPAPDERAAHGLACPPDHGMPCKVINSDEKAQDCTGCNGTGKVTTFDGNEWCDKCIGSGKSADPAKEGK